MAFLLQPCGEEGKLEKKIGSPLSSSISTVRKELQIKDEKSRDANLDDARRFVERLVIAE